MAPPPKQEELQPHPVKDQLPSITSPPPWSEAVLRGSQHYSEEEKAKMIQTILFVAGVNTLFQTFFGTRLPAVINASYTFVPTTVSIVLAGRYSDIIDPLEKFKKIMRGI